MSTETPLPVTASTAVSDPVRQGLADADVARRLMALIHTALGHFPAGMTFAQRQGQAEELFQEVSKQAIASAHGFDPERGSLLHWLGGIVWNLAKQRKPGHFQPTEPTTLQEMIVDAQDAVPDDVAHRLDSEAILQCVPPSDAELLRLHAEGWTAHEIGERLTLTPGNVRVRLSRLIKRIRGMFQKTNLEVDHD